VPTGGECCGGSRPRSLTRSPFAPMTTCDADRGRSSCAGHVRDGAATQLLTDAIGRDFDASSSPIDG
jgi:hypothetical protein